MQSAASTFVGQRAGLAQPRAAQVRDARHELQPDEAVPERDSSGSAVADAPASCTQGGARPDQLSRF